MPFPTDTGAPTPSQPLDALILAAATAEWTKVAVFISRVVDVARAQGIDATGQAIAARLYALVEDGRIAAQGNVRRWRAGEVRKATAA